jgi:hypothetical protein
MIMRTLITVCLLAMTASEISAQAILNNPGSSGRQGGDPPGIESFLLEGFEELRFPPAGWQLEYGGALYWKWWAGVSGYGIGSASAMFDFGTAPTGTTQSLVVVLPGPSTSGDSIKFDHAYATYHLSLIDQLVIQISSDGGISYATLVTLNGGASGPLTTAPPTTVFFVPTASQWATKSYALPPGTNRIRFTAISAWGNNLFLDNCTIGHRLSDDVGTQAIDIANPTMAVPQIPRVQVKNHGTSVQTFTVTMSISPGGYSSTKTVTALDGNAVSEVLFDQWTPTPGSCNVAVYTELGTDMDRLNDTLRSTVTVNEAATVTNINAFYRHGQVFITWDNLSMTNVVYTVYRSPAPIRHGYELISAQNLGTVHDSSALDLRLSNLSGGQRKYLKIDSSAAPLAGNKGLFVATSTADDSLYYAVTARPVGSEDTTIAVGSNSLLEPVGESVRAPQPVWQESRNVSGRTFEIYVQYGTKVTSPIYPQMTNAGSFPFHFALVKSGTVSPHPVTFWLHGSGGSFLPTTDYRVTGDPNEWVITIDDWTPNSTDFSLTYYYGYHEGYDMFSGTNAVPSSGTLFNYTGVRVIHTVEWALKNLPVDTTRTYVTGYSMGATGTVFTVMMIPSKIAAMFIIAPWLDLTIPPPTNPGPAAIVNRLWGTAETNLPTNQGYTRNERLDAFFLLRAHEDNSFPVVYTFCGKADLSTGWEEKVALYNLMDSTRLGGHHFWSNTNHYQVLMSSPWAPSFPNFSFLTKYRTNLSYPAFSHCSINDNPGNGNPTNGDAIGSINGHLDWNDNIVDSTNRWEITLRLKNLSTTFGSDIAPDSATTDVSLRRLQAFNVPPGYGINWENRRRNTVVQQGFFAYSGGLITIPGVKVYKDSSRLTVTPSSPLVIPILDKWNLLSCPVAAEHDSVSDLFPTAVSPAYSYENGTGYHEQHRMTEGIGYWVKFSGAQSATVTGFTCLEDTLDVVQGWNVIGSISAPVAVSDIASIPGGIVTSDFYWYDGTYGVVDTIFPGRAYWVMVGQQGQLVLSALGRAAVHNLIRIETTAELPPPLPDLEVAQGGGLPTAFALYDNFPNPFNPSTTIRYELPKASHVSLSIYDMLGREVATLLNEEKSAGTYTVQWDASGVSSGVYLYRLNAGGFVHTKRMIVVK